MKIFKTSLLLTLLFLITTSVFAQKRRSVSNLSSASAAATRSHGPSVDLQTGNTILCKGLPLPEGFVIAGEMFSDSCQASAWIIKQKSGPPVDVERFNARTDAFANLAHSPAAVVEPNETITPGQCDSFQQTIKGTYNFKPALMNESQVEAQSEKLDTFWAQARQSRATLLPCLRQALKQDKSGSFFAIDGSMLLVDMDPSVASKALQVRKFIEADLDGTDLEYWVATMARRGVEGFDTSEAGAKWLSYPKAKYELSMHGGYPVGPFVGAVFIFGSMDEELATPVLLRIANDVRHPHRDDAIAILSSLATPSAYRALKQINPAGLSADAQKTIAELLDHPKVLQPRIPPKLTREENLRAFQGIVVGDYSAFREMVWKAPDGEVDAVATLLPEDIPLLRRARRASISRCNQHALSDYASFTAILKALTWKADVAAPTTAAR
jgi:hypothetical protein